VVFTAAGHGTTVVTQLGADGFLEKPVETDQLLAMVMRLLAGSLR
jgi:hypothetical protein